MDTLLQQINKSGTWNDLRVSIATLDGLKEIEAQIRPGQGFRALFTGPSGIDKTLAAIILANALGQPLYRVDLARVVSKYIGETEKNLSAVFEHARKLDVVLLFDEADALFGNRTDVKDSHDRYANLEANYLLQSIEDYPGLVILTSNLRADLDDVFIQRMTWDVKFVNLSPTPRIPWWRRVLMWFGFK